MYAPKRTCNNFLQIINIGSELLVSFTHCRFAIYSIYFIVKNCKLKKCKQLELILTKFYTSSNLLHAHSSFK